MSTIGAWYFTSRIDKIKDKKIDELIKGKNELISQIEGRDREQGVRFEKMDKKLDKLVDAKAISKETAKEIKTIYSETLTSNIKASVSVKDELIPAKKPSVENK
jgi:hypothetical protein